MAVKQITIDNIFGGISQAEQFSERGQYQYGLAIDPDQPLSDVATARPSGAIRPVGYAKFSSTGVDSAVIAVINTPKNTNTYLVTSGGKLISYNSSLASESVIGTVTGSVASGAAYYNNYIYIFGTGASANDVSRYGPLDNSPTLTNAVWTGATLGSLTALTNTTYPTTRHSVKYLNHPTCVHVDNKLYFGDYKNGIGYIHYIRTTKTTDQGDTNSASTYNALDLPFGYMPYAIASYGLNIVIAACKTNDTAINQGNAALFFWDTTSASFSRVVEIPDPICSALIYANGALYGLSGSLQGGTRLFRYVGGDTIQTLKSLAEGHPPLSNAVIANGNRIIWAGFGTKPTNHASIYAFGSRSDLFPRGLHNIARSTVTATASNGLVTAIGKAQQDAGALQKYIIAGTDGTNYNVDAISTTYQTSVIWSQYFNIGREFTIKRISLRLGTAVASNMTIIPKLYFDEASSSQAGTTINSTNYANSQRYVVLTPDNFSNNVSGKNDFFLELTISGTSLSPIQCPISIDVEISDQPTK